MSAQSQGTLVDQTRHVSVREIERRRGCGCRDGRRRQSQGPGRFRVRRVHQARGRAADDDSDLAGRGARASQDETVFTKVSCRSRSWRGQVVTGWERHAARQDGGLVLAWLPL